MGSDIDGNTEGCEYNNNNNKIKVNRGGGSRGDSEIGTKGGIFRSGVDLSWICEGSFIKDGLRPQTNDYY